ncbi:MAG: NFACT RNA binding domain-containing protein, partial [Planctomycetota bacterium]
MSLSYVDLSRAVEEQGALRGSHVDNVYQCGPKVFLIKLKPEKAFLLIDVRPGKARVLVTDEPPAVPDRPPVFGSILRQAIRGGRVLGTMLLGEDRIVAVDVQCGETVRRLVVEAFSRHANLLLLDSDGKVERVLDGDAARHRGNPVGADYSLPPPRKPPAEESMLPASLADEPFAVNYALDRLMRKTAATETQKEAEKERAGILARLARARNAAARDLSERDDPDALREKGALLIAHFDELRTGMRKFKSIPLDPKLTPPENVDRLFQRARKAARAGPILEERIRQLDALVAKVEAGETVPESRLPGRKKGGKQPPRRPYRTFVSVDGHRILVGKGGRDNDETTLRVAGPHDLFLHVRGTPGAHVILPLKRTDPVPEQALIDAAHLALHYSKSR